MLRYLIISNKSWTTLTTSEDHLNTLKMILIKACDISNECRPIMVSEGWVECLMEEYFQQSDKEKRDALPVAPFMDRDRVTKPTAQIGFIKYVLLPLFEALNKLYPEIEEIALEHLRQALTHYEKKKDLEERKKRFLSNPDGDVETIEAH